MPELMMSIPLAQLKPSPSNPRKHFDDSKTAELAASIGKVGVLEPIIVRRGKRDCYEIVCGERRFRAATLAKVEGVPAIIREYSDDDVLEIQITENSQRENPHPLDEADGFKALVDRGRTPASVADKIGRPTKYVLERLQLCELSPAGRKAFDDERLSLSSAMILARIPGSKLQDKALEECTRGYRFDGVLPAKRVGEMVRDRFMLKLAGAPFDRSDAKLVPKAGACSVCPKRSGNQTELFDDVKSPDICTDPTCYRSKLDAHWKIAVAAAKVSGQKVLGEKEAKKLFPYSTDELGYGTAYVDLGGHIRHPTTRKEVAVKKLVTKDTAITLARAPKSGRILQLVSRSTVESALKRGGKAGKGKAKSQGHDRKAVAKINAAEKARREREKAKADAADAVTLGLMEEAADRGSNLLGINSTGFLVHLLEQWLDNGHEGFSLFLKRRKLVEDKARGWAQEHKLKAAIVKEAQGESPAWIWSAVVELLVGELGTMTFGSNPKRFAALLDELQIDRKEVEKRVLKELAAAKAAAAAEPKAPPATKPKPAKKRKARKS
jgi:ParB/RepB/Spo0J family partition protein